MFNKVKKILILEDDLRTLTILMQILEEFKNSLNSIAVTVFSESVKAQNFLEKEKDFDLIFLDYYGIDEDFHKAVFENKIDPKKIIAISSLREKNLEAEDKGVLRTVEKDFINLEDFKIKLKQEIKEML
jgi:CheY-like chemotaxis protein